MKKKQTTGERIAEGTHTFHPVAFKGAILDAKMARRIDSALKRAVREGYDAGWGDGGGTNKNNDGWNRLAKKYGMRSVE